MFNTPEGNRLLRFGSLVLIVLSAFLVVEIIYVIRQTANVTRQPATNVISVNGKGEVTAVPDVATFTFGDNETSESVKSAQDLVTKKMNSALDMLKKAGVEDKDIKTVAYFINPHYEFHQPTCVIGGRCPSGNQVITGYDVSQTVEVKIRDISKSSDILSQLGKTGVTNLSGLNFTVDDQEKVQANARDLAIQDARAQAEKLAKGLGVHIVRVVGFSENNYFPYEAYGKGGDMAVAPVSAQPQPQVPVGENKVTSNVSISYEIR